MRPLRRHCRHGIACATSGAVSFAGTPYTFRMAPAVVVVIFTVLEGRLSVLLIERAAEPCQGEWALPGGLLQQNETLDGAASRKLQDETGLTDVFLEQLYSFDATEQGNAGIVVAYFALLPAAQARLRRGAGVASGLARPARPRRSRLRERAHPRLRTGAAAEQARLHERRLQLPAAALHAAGAARCVRGDPGGAGGQAELPPADGGAGHRAAHERDPQGRGPPPRPPLRIRLRPAVGVLAARLERKTGAEWRANLQEGGDHSSRRIP